MIFVEDAAELGGETLGVHGVALVLPATD